LEEVKKLILILLLLSIAFVTFKIITKKETVYLPVEVEKEKSSEVELKTIDQDAVFDAIESQIQIVGTSGSLDKVFNYDDSNFFGKRRLSMKVTATYKLGYSLNDLIINPERVIINDGVIAIVVPKLELISLEIPYEDAVISDEDGWLRKKIKESEKQDLFEHARTEIEREIFANDELINKSYDQTNKALKEILMVVDGVSDVRFVRSDY
jgi:hypothetical protein